MIFIGKSKMMNSRIAINRHYSLLNFLIICILLQNMNSE